MRKIQLYNKAFTLVEVLISITIFSVIITSIIWIYVISSDIILKSDINRIMQENLKNVSNTIAEDIRKNGILGVSISSDSFDTCNNNIFTNNYKVWDKLCIDNIWNNYYLAIKNPIWWDFIRTDASSCLSLNSHCVIYYSNTLDSSKNWPLTNSYVSVKDLKFYFSEDNVAKVTINIILQPSVKKWVKAELIKESKIIFQTTVSERPF